MKVEKVITGILSENCYILSINNDAIVIDPGDDYLKIKTKIKDKNVLAVLITHYHFDHIGALKDLKEDFDVRVIDYKNSGKINIGDFLFEIIETKGHSENSVTYYFYNDKIMFTGDFLFKESIGRCDLEGGNILKMKESINKIKKYDKNITIYPGHGDKTNLGYELKNNYYLGENYE